MAKVLYFLVTFLESGLAVFGIRAPFEQPSYRVVARLSDGVEIRAYGPGTVVETAMGSQDGEAFSRLFRYITGANTPGDTIAMTTPVEMRGTVSARPAGARTGAEVASDVMRFSLPAKLAADPPLPKDPRVHIVHLPARTVAVLRFSGRLDRESVERHETRLRTALDKAKRQAESAAYVMGYDPPFTIPFLRRNEVAIDVEA